MNWGSPFQDIDKKEALCLLLVCEKRRKLITGNKGGRNGLHAYAWGCYFYFCFQGIPTTFT